MWVRRDRPLVRYYPVFHPGQCDGLAVEELAEPVRRIGDPAYAPAQDVIFMPPEDRFGCVESYYATLFHEMTHWTGHTNRLKRDGVVKKAFFGSEQYGREELTAEVRRSCARSAGWRRRIRRRMRRRMWLDGSGPSGKVRRWMW